MRRFLMLVTGIVALGFPAYHAMAQPGANQIAAMSPQLSPLELEIQGDYAAIQRDKDGMDRDRNNPALYARDRHQLYEDTETQEYHRGTNEELNLAHNKGW